MRPRYVLHLGPEAFGQNTVCLGFQISAIINIINKLVSDLRWYIADVQTTGYQFPQGRQAAPTLVGDVQTLTRLLEDVDQFESGVFVAVPAGLAHPVFRNGGLWTEDNEFADLGDAIVEIRAFDTAYIMIGSRDLMLLSTIEQLPHE